MAQTSARAGALVATVLTLLLGAAGCTSSGAPARSSPPASQSVPADLSTQAAPLPATPPSTPTTLAAYLQRGFATFGYARIAFSTALSGNSLSGAGPVRLAGGQVNGLDLQATVSKIGSVHYLLVDGDSYAGLPHGTAGKTYALLGGSQSSDQLTRAALGFQAAKLLAAPATYRTLVAAASSVTLIDRLPVAGVPALHYRGPVSVDKIPTTDPVGIALSALGVRSLALELWVDGAGRPIKASAPADGRASNVTFTEVNRPFQLAAPPASAVAK